MSNFGENTFPKHIKEAFDSVDVVGEVVRDTFTSHGLLATCITFFEAEHQMEVISRKLGHRDLRLAFSFHNAQSVLT